jgi:retron-type reverse transcriptase
MAVCEPVLERAAVFDSYACRKGKGRLAAVERASGYARRHDWFLKMDVRKYFASIDHLLLERLLQRRFKDPAVLALFGEIIRSHETAPGRGLPIGNLTSQ